MSELTERETVQDACNKLKKDIKEAGEKAGVRLYDLLGSMDLVKDILETVESDLTPLSVTWWYGIKEQQKNALAKTNKGGKK